MISPRLPFIKFRVGTFFVLVVPVIVCRFLHIHTRRDLAIEGTPSGDYAPMAVTCPSNFTVRVPQADSSFLGNGEAHYISQKAKNSTRIWRAYLSRSELTDFDIEKFLNCEGVAGKTLPNLGLALSGGGLRALFGGAGTLHAFDDRNDQAMQEGTGGILQLANYITALSGSSWLVGSWATSNYPTFTELNRTVWHLTGSKSYKYWDAMKSSPKAFAQAKKKSKAGFPASLVDAGAYILSRSLINDTHHGSRVLFSSIKNTTGYKDHSAPFPILISTSRHDGTYRINYDTPIYEFNPEEFGISHPTLRAFIPMEYLGSRMTSGKPMEQFSCTRGFDNAGFVMAASSNVLSRPGAQGSFYFSWNKILEKLYDKLTKHIYDEAIIPNPFFKMGDGFGTGKGYPDRESEYLYLADGGWANEIVPFWPLLQPERKVDVIIAIDYTADTTSMNREAYTNGSSLYMTYMKAKKPGYEGAYFPKMPGSPEQFLRKGLNQRPTFLGCNETHAPLIIYLPNYFAVANTGTPTLKVDYFAAQIDGFFQNSFAIATQERARNQWQNLMDNSTQEMLERAGPIATTKWRSCLACALIDRQLKRNRTPRSPQYISKNHQPFTQHTPEDYSLSFITPYAIIPAISVGDTFW
ncbi:hypothetical protein O181_021309 [Austropuccinia psidii MF-1]|uniref:Lysophospholipase n=1 Tax=Austropuccinia psidii MF-1 TaxID=1389203 RepID=A0A9Q3CCX5_9BASI|nr:hypothetical protein [Austropuccinia psidii MF-1]